MANRAEEMIRSHWSWEKPVIVASNHLPVQLSKSGDGQWAVKWTGDFMSETQAFSQDDILQDRVQIKFVGRVEDSTVVIPKEEEEKVREVCLRYNCFPVFIDKDEAAQYYSYCKRCLWPTFHNILDVYSPIEVAVDETEQELNCPESYWTPTGQQKSWQAYTNVNKAFANKICELYEDGDVIWLQDYHLLVCASYITRKIRAANIGLFLHVPFPSSEVFRSLSCRKELLRGMLNADHVGFHLYDYARHFLMCCKRVLGVNDVATRGGNGGTLGLSYGGRRVSVTCVHMAVEMSRLDTELNKEVTRSLVITRRQQYPNKVIFAAVDAIERLKGIPLKMLAFDQFLTRCPEYIGRVVLVQVGLRSGVRHRLNDYRQSLHEIQSVVNRINTKYLATAENNVIEFEQQNENMTLGQRLALWRVADVYVSTVLRDGLNTCPFEYSVTHRNGTGVVIVSEFSGCSNLLSGAISVNPWNLDQVIDAMRDAVSMSVQERECRRRNDLIFIGKNSPKKWAKCVLDDIVASRKKTSEFVYMGTGFGLDFRLLEVKATFRKLEESVLSVAYRQSSRRVLFLDYLNTLSCDKKHTCNNNSFQSSWPDVSASVLSSLEFLCKDPRNTVFIVSGCSKELIEEKFGSVPGLGLTAEHGRFIRYGVTGNKARLDRPWQDGLGYRSCYNMITGDGGGQEQDSRFRKWPEIVQSIMLMYVDRTNGSDLEIKDSAILFRFTHTELEFGLVQAQELQEYLQGVIQCNPGEGLYRGSPKWNWERMPQIPTRHQKLKLSNKNPKIHLSGPPQLSTVLEEDLLDSQLTPRLRSILHSPKRKSIWFGLKKRSSLIAIVVLVWSYLIVASSSSSMGKNKWWLVKAAKKIKWRIAGILLSAWALYNRYISSNSLSRNGSIRPQDKIQIQQKQE